MSKLGQNCKETTTKEEEAAAGDDEERKDEVGEAEPKHGSKEENAQESRREPPAKCPMGYDSGSFKIGPLSCVICRALLFDSSRCLPCRHIYCRACISRFKDCPLCGADVDEIVPDPEMQTLVDQFIEGHARIKGTPLNANSAEGETGESEDQSNVVYEDASSARGSFLVQQAMRAFQAQNLESAKARLGLCVEDSREEILHSGSNAKNCSQLGALLGMLGDCCRAMDDTDGAIANYKESADLLSKLEQRDSEVVHALSVSLNKLGDLKYYAQDLEGARAFYAQALDVRVEATQDFKTLSPQVLDVAVSLAKVADVDRALGNESAACEGFQEAVKKLEGLSMPKNSENSALAKRRFTVLEFLHSQISAPT